MYKYTLIIATLILTACSSNYTYIPKDGKDGVDGTDGKDGQGCTQVATTNGSIITCGTSTVVILNGKDAPPTAYTVVQIIDPCGKQTAFDEVLLKLANGSILAHYASGSNQFLTYVTPGSFVTTDGTNCHFTVSSTGNVSW